MGGTVNLYYDLETKLWHVFDSNITNLSTNYYLVNATKNSGSTPTCLQAYAPGNTSGTAKYGRLYRFDTNTNDRVDTDVSAVAQDLDFVIQLPRYRGDKGIESQRKFMHELQIIGDTQAATDNISVQYSDDDYQTFSTARTIDMGQTLKQLNRLGLFRERVFKLSYSGTNQIRLESLEGDLTVGRN